MILSCIYNYNIIILYYNKAIKQYNTIIIHAHRHAYIYYNKIIYQSTCKQYTSRNKAIKQYNIIITPERMHAYIL